MPVSIAVTGPSVLVARELFNFGDGAAVARVLPPELRHEIYESLDRSTLLRLRRVSKAVCADVLAIHRREFNSQRGNYGPKISLGAMLHRQSLARNGAACGEITRTLFEIDADYRIPGVFFFDRTSGEYIALTRTGQVVAIGPYGQGAVVPILEPDMLQTPRKDSPAPRSLAGPQSAGVPAVLLGAVTLPGGRRRRVLTHHAAQGVRLWSCGDSATPRWCTLLFKPSRPLDARGIRQSQITLSADGYGVIYEANAGSMVWRWRAPDGFNSGLEISSTHTDYANERVRVSAKDGLILRHDIARLMITDSQTGSSNWVSSNGTVLKLIPFSPCGRWVGTITRDLRYRINGEGRRLFWLTLYGIARLPDGSPTLRRVMEVDGPPAVAERPWHYNQQDGWSLHAAGTVLVADGRYMYSTRRPDSVTNAWLNNIEFWKIKSGGKDFNGSAYYFVQQHDGYRGSFLVRKSADGVCSRILIHSKLANSLAEEVSPPLPMLWSQDGTTLIRTTANVRENTVFELVQMMKERSEDSAWISLKRVLQASGCKAVEALQSKRLFPQIMGADGGVNSVTLSCFLGAAAVGFLAAEGVFSGFCIWLGVFAGSLMVVVAVDCLAVNTPGHRPWDAPEVTSAH